MKGRDLILFSAVKDAPATSIDAEVLKRTRELMRTEGLNYRDAFKALLACDVDLERRYHGRHNRELPENYQKEGRSARLAFTR